MVIFSYFRADAVPAGGYFQVVIWYVFVPATVRMIICRDWCSLREAGHFTLPCIGVVSWKRCIWAACALQKAYKGELWEQKGGIWFIFISLQRGGNGIPTTKATWACDTQCLLRKPAWACLSSVLPCVHGKGNTETYFAVPGAPGFPLVIFALFPVHGLDLFPQPCDLRGIFSCVAFFLLFVVLKASHNCMFLHNITGYGGKKRRMRTVL